MYNQESFETDPDREFLAGPGIVWYEQMQEVAGERGGYLHGRGGTCPP